MMAPTYELSLILKSSLSKPEVKNALQRICTSILEEGGVIRKLQNLGTRQLPYRMKDVYGAKRVTHGSYFVVEFSGKASATNDLVESMYRDVDVIRWGALNLDQREASERTRPSCTLGTEVLPPPYTPEVLDRFKPLKGRGPPPEVLHEPY